MADVTKAADSLAAEQGTQMRYDAFLSYAHRDKEVTTAIQKGLHQIGRRVGQLRALRVFRDDTNLIVDPDLWGKITEALDSSRFMIVVLSPQSAASHWVNEEVSYWIQRRGHEQLMLMLAQGHLEWDEKNKRFDPEHSDAAPPVLAEPGSLAAEPLYIDVSEDPPWDVRDRTFRDKLTSLAAPIHGKDKDQLTGDDVREQRRFRRLRGAAIGGLAMLTVIAVVAAVIAVAQRGEAVRRLHEAVVAKLDAEGASMLSGTMPGGDVRALQELLAAHASASNPDDVPILNAQISRFTTQKIVDTALTPHRLAYSPDGRRIATAEDAGTVRQWDAATGEPIGASIKGTGTVEDVAFTPDGRLIASTSNDGTMRLWNADTGAAVNPNPDRVGGLSSVAVSQNHPILTGGANDTIQLWDPHSGHLLASQQVFDDHTASIMDVAFDRTGNLIAVGADDGGIAVYQTRPFKVHAPMMVVRGGDSKPAPVWMIAFSPDGHTIAAGSDTLQLWNADTGTLIRTIQVGTANMTGVMAVAFSPDGHRIATGRVDGALQLWDVDTGAQLGKTSIEHTAAVMGVAFNPDGRQIATASLDGTLRLWNANVSQPMSGPVGAVQVAFSPDGQRVAASGNTGVQQWDIHSGQPLPALTGGGAGTHLFGYVDGGRIVTAADDGTLQVWDANTGQPAKAPVHLAIRPGDFPAVFTRNAHTLASANFDNGALRLWDVATGEPIGQPMTIDPKTTLNSGGLAFSPDGHRLIAGYDDGSLRVWNTDNAQLDETVVTKTGFNGITAVAVSPDATIVAAGHADGAVELWDLSTRKQLPDSPLHGHTGMVTRAVFGVAHQLATGGLGDLRLWDTATGRPTAVPQPVSDAITSVAVSPGGRLTGWSTTDGTLRLSPAIADPSQLCDKLPTNMSHKHWNDWVSPAIPYITVCPGLPIAPD